MSLRIIPYKITSTFPGAISEPVINSAANGFLPIWCQAIIQMNVDLLRVKTLGIYLYQFESVNGKFCFLCDVIIKSIIFFQEFSPTTSSDILKTVEAVNADWDFFKGTEITIILY